MVVFDVIVLMFRALTLEVETLRCMTGAGIELMCNIDDHRNKSALRFFNTVVVEEFAQGVICVKCSSDN